MNDQDTSQPSEEEFPPEQEELPPFPDIAAPEGVTDADALSETPGNLVCQEFCVYLRGRPWKDFYWCDLTIEALNQKIRDFLVSLHNQGFTPVETQEGRCPGR